MRKFSVFLARGAVPALSLQHYEFDEEEPEFPKPKAAEDLEFPHAIIRALHGPGHQIDNVQEAAPYGFTVRVKHHKLPRLPFDELQAAGWRVVEVHEHALRDAGATPVGLGRLPGFLESAVFKLYADWNIMGGMREMRTKLGVRHILSYGSDHGRCPRCKHSTYRLHSLDPTRAAIRAREDEWWKREAAQ